MLKMQTLFAECHKDSRLSYSLEIPIAQFARDEYEVLVRDPDGTVRQQAVGGGCIRISRSDAPGVWRFTAEVRSCKDPNDVVDTITAEAVIFPRTEPAVQSAVTETIASVGARTNCGYLYGSSEDFDVSGKAAKLSRQFGETACLELLRRLGLEPPDQTGVLRSLLLVKAGLAPSTARGLLPFAIPVLTELVAGALPAITD